MEECLNANWSIDIPHLNITYQKNTLKELQWKLDNMRSEIQEDKNTKKLVTFLIYWSIAASLLNCVLLLLAITRPARAGDSGTGNNLNNVHMGILWLCTVALSAILIYYCINGIGKRIVQWYESRKSRRAQPSNGNTETIPLDPPVSHHDNLGGLPLRVPNGRIRAWCIVLSAVPDQTIANPTNLHQEAQTYPLPRRQVAESVLQVLSTNRTPELRRVNGKVFRSSSLQTIYSGETD
ncbi:hypothetical protein ABEB36_015022 [Hypothenemus hampei]|uniref:Uncharacterized protein n=1 Tax=Hypothenemus hampei TaxID=57062 RepID=A0ABD1E1K2_HYPHA